MSARLGRDRHLDRRARHRAGIEDSDPKKARYHRIIIMTGSMIAGALSAGLLADPNRAIEAAHATAERPNRLAPEHERNWHGEVIAGEGLVFRRTRQGVDERRLIDAALLRNAEARRLAMSSHPPASRASSSSPMGRWGRRLCSRFLCCAT